MALAGPVLGHLDPQFLALLDSTNDRLRQVFGTANALTLPVSGTGSAGMEASFVNFVRPGRPGRRRRQRRVRRADVRGGVPPRRRGRPGRRRVGRADRPGSPARRRTRRPALIAVVHAETSTGVRNDIAPLGARQGRRAAAGRHGDVAGGHRGRRRRLVGRHRLQRHPEVPGGPAGPVAVHGLGPGPGADRRAAVELVPRSQPSGALREGRLGRGTGVPPHGAGDRWWRRCTPGSAPSSTRGSQAAWAAPRRVRPAAAGRAGRPRARAARRRRRTACRSSPPCGSRPASTTPRCRRELLSAYGIEIGAGAGQLAGQIWRIGCMGHTARRRNVVALLGALREVLGR